MLVKWEFLTNGGREQAPTLGQTDTTKFGRNRFSDLLENTRSRTWG